MNAFERFTTPPINELETILSYLPYDDREVWYKTFVIVGREYKHDSAAFDACQRWSAQYSGRTASDRAKERTEFYSSSNRDGAGIGTLIRLAKQNGYKPQPLESSQRTLEASRSAIDLIRVPKYTPTPSEATGGVLVGLYGDAQEHAQAVLKFWLWTESSPIPVRAAFMRRYSQAFSLLPETEGRYLELLNEYAQCHALYSFNAFAQWAEEQYQNFNLDDLVTLMAGAKQLENEEAADRAMQYAVQASWRVTMQARALELAEALKDSANDAAKAEKLIKHFAETSRPFNPQLPAIGAHDVAPVGRKMLSELLNPKLSKMYYVPTGYSAIDEHIYGWRRGECTIVAAHSGVGKTWLGVDAANKVIRAGGRVLFITTEMSRESIAERFYTNTGCLSLGVLRTAENPDELLNAASKDSQALYTDNEALNIVYADELGQVISAIDSRKAFTKIDLVVVDYLQNISNQSFGSRNTQNYERVQNVMAELTKAAARNECPILALAQLNNPNRKTSNNKEPNLYDIADATAVVRDAAAVMVMYKVSIGTEGMTELRAMIHKSRYGSLPETPFQVLRTAGSRFNFQ